MPAPDRIYLRPIGAEAPIMYASEAGSDDGQCEAYIKLSLYSEVVAQRDAALPAVTPAPDATVKRVVDLLDDLTERQWVLDGLTVSEIKEIADAIGAVREVQSHKSE